MTSAFAAGVCVSLCGHRAVTAVLSSRWVPSLTGLPALAVPCGFDGDGLLIGRQVIGRSFDEPTVLRVGAAYQQMTHFREQAPPAFG